MRALSFILAALALHLAASAALAAELQVSAPWVRAVPPGQPNSAAFMTLENRSDTPRALVAARSPASEVVELHTHLQEDGMMRMRRIAQIELPPGTPVILKPGSLHLMLIGLREPLAPEATVALTLILDDGSEIAVTAPIRSIVPPDAHMDH